jgi:hypothetical protein
MGKRWIAKSRGKKKRKNTLENGRSKLDGET